MNWKDGFLDIFLEKTAYKTNLFHGTSIYNLENILEKGLINNIFLTPSIERAAYYAYGPNSDQTPVILDIVLTKPKRLKKLKWDSLDREEDHLGDDDGYGYTDQFKEDIDIIENIINEDILLEFYDIIGYEKYLKDIELKLHYARIDGLQTLEGYNIYKEILNGVRIAINNPKEFKKIKNALLRKIHSSLPANQEITDFIKITNNGTIRIKPEYFDSLKQFHYKEKYVPPTAIKFLWVKQSDYPDLNYIEKRTFDIDPIPQVRVQYFESANNSIAELIDYSNLFNFSYDINPENKQEENESFIYICNESKSELEFFVEKSKSNPLIPKDLIDLLIIINKNYLSNENFIKQCLTDDSKKDILIQKLNNAEEEFRDFYEIIYEYDPSSSNDIEIDQAIWIKIPASEYFKITKNLSFNNKLYNRTWGD